MAVLTAGGGGLIPDIVLLIGGFCALPAHHRVALRTDESGSAGREVEAGGLAVDDGDGSLAALRNTVAEGNIVVLDDELDN